MRSASRQPANGKSKDSNRRSIQDISWVWTATKLATSQEKQLPLRPLAPTLTSAFLLSLCFLQSFPSWIETFGRLISLHLFQLWCNCGNNSTTVGWKVEVISWFLFFFKKKILLFYCIIVIFRDGPRSELCKRSTPTVWEGLEWESNPDLSLVPKPKLQSWKSSNRSCRSNSVDEASLRLWWDKAVYKDLNSAIAWNNFLCSLMGKKVIKEGWESQLLPCLPEVVNEATQRWTLMVIM